MCCHKKCINKCQNSTICGPVEATGSLQPQVEFKVTDADVNDDELEESDEVSSNRSGAQLTHCVLVILMKCSFS